MAQTPVQHGPQSRPGRQQQAPQQAAQVPPPQPVWLRRRTRFKGWFLGVPLLLVLGAWVYRSVDVAVSWEELCEAWGIRDVARFTRLAILGVACVAVAALVKVLRHAADEQE